MSICGLVWLRPLVDALGFRRLLLLFAVMLSKRILVIENDALLRASWQRVLNAAGYETRAAADRETAQAMLAAETFGLILSDLTDADTAAAGMQPINEAVRQRLHQADASAETSIIKAFRFDATSWAQPDYSAGALHDLLESVLRHKQEVVDEAELLPHIHESIDFLLPSDVALMHPLLDYLLHRAARAGSIPADNTHLFVALDEAFVNAVKHGNKFDPSKIVFLSAEISPQEARFTIEDEGTGFNIHEIPDPCDPANLFKTSGRGVLLIHNIMDEVRYNERGNRITLIKRPKVG